MARRAPEEQARRRRLRDQAKHTGNYRPGFKVHPIQARKAAETLQDSEVGRIVGITHRGIHVLIGDELRRYGGNREVARALAAEHGSRVRIQHRWALLWINTHPISVRGPLNERRQHDRDQH